MEKNNSSNHISPKTGTIMSYCHLTSYNSSNHISPKTRKQIAQAYGINYKTLMSRLKRKEIILPPGLLFLEEQEMIYQALGRPKIEEESDKK